MNVDKIVISSPGTPYDWQNPENYKPPSYLTEEQVTAGFALNMHSMAEQVDYVERTEPRTPRKKSRVWPVAKTALKFLFWGGVVAPTVVSGFVNTVSSPNQYECPTTPDQPPVDEAGNLAEARAKVANMNFGIEKEVYDNLKTRLNDAETLEEIEQITQEAMDPFGINVTYADVPQRQLGLFRVADVLKSHSPDLITTEEAKASTDAFLVNLSRIPRSFLDQLNGYNLYFTHNPTILFDHRPGGYFEQGSLLSESSIVLDTSFPDQIAGYFNHEIMHPLHNQQCGKSIGENKKQGAGDTDFTAKNPPGFVYHTDEKLRLEAKEKGVTMTMYGASDYGEDIPETGESLLNGDYAYDRQVNGQEIVAYKQHVMAQRLALIEPDFEYYAAYLGYVGGNAFPKELAQQDSLTAECFNYDPTNNGSSGTVEPINMMVYDYADWNDDLPPGQYKFLKVRNPNTANPAAPNIYRTAWITPEKTETYAHIQKQIGWSILEELKSVGEAPVQAVEFTFHEQPAKIYGQTRVTCTTFEQLSM